MKLHHLFTYDFSPGKIYKVPDAPASILWDICYLCNQRCKFCYNSSASFQKTLPDFELTKNIAKKICEWGVKEIIYLGGEPTIHPGLLEIIELVCQYRREQRLISNGAFINQKMAKQFMLLGVETGISLHSVDPERHDDITQIPGSFNKALNAISLLEEINAKWYLQYTPTFCGESFYNSISKIKRRFPSLKVVDVNRLMPQGVGANTAIYYQNQESLWKCLSDIPNIMNLGIKVSVESVPHCWIRKKGKEFGFSVENINKIIQSIRPCYMAINQAAMDDYGKLKLCPGGISCTESILKIPPTNLWKHSIPFEERRKFSFLPRCCIDFAKGIACDNFYQCGGGCKMSATECCALHSKSDFLIEK